MTIATDEQNLFRTVPTKSLAKGDITNNAARAIIRTETEHQHAKTKRLREARLAFEALLPPALPEARARLPKTDRRRRAATASEVHPGKL
jgi:hypothetical protein